MEENFKSRTDRIVLNTWILLLIIWTICLIPVPGTSYVAWVLNFGALVMTIVNLVRGWTRQGLLQLLGVFVVTPIFDVLGMIVFLTFVSHAVDPHHMTAKSLSDAVISNYETEINKYNGLVYKEFQAGKKAVLQGKEKVVEKITPESQEKEQQKPVVYSKYLVYLKNGGKLDSASVSRHDTSLKLKSVAGVVIDIDVSKVEKIVKVETINNKTSVTSLEPGKI